MMALDEKERLGGVTDGAWRVCVPGVRGEVVFNATIIASHG